MIRHLGYREMGLASLRWADTNDLVARMKAAHVVELAATYDVTDGPLNAPIVRRSDKKIISGHDRIAAAELIKRKTVDVHLVEGTDDEMAEVSIIENLNRRRDDQDALKRRLVEMRAAKVAKRAVTKLPLTPAPEPKPGRPKGPEAVARQELAPALQTTPAALKQAAYRDRKKEHDVRTNGHAAPPAIREEPPPPIRTFGLPLPAAIRDVVAPVIEAIDKADRHNRQILGELTRWSQVPGADEDKANQLHSLFRKTGAEMRLARPEALCPYCKGLTTEHCSACLDRRYVTAIFMAGEIPSELLRDAPDTWVAIGGRPPAPWHPLANGEVPDVF